MFKIGDKVKCLHPEIVLARFKNVTGEVTQVYDHGLLKILYPSGTPQRAYIEDDGVVKVEEAPTEPTAGANGKIASDGGPSDYYDFPEGCSTLNDLIEYKGMSFAQGNIFKAAYRLGNKEGITLEYDLNKIKYYADRMLAQLDSERN